MKVKEQLIEESSLEEFLDSINLDVIVSEGSTADVNRLGEDCRFFAHVPEIELKSGCYLVSTFGKGDTKTTALRNLAIGFSEQVAVVDAMKPTRKEYEIPRLTQVFKES